MEDQLSIILEKVSHQALLSKDQLIRKRLEVLLDKLREFEPIILEIKELSLGNTTDQEMLKPVHDRIWEELSRYGCDRRFLMPDLAPNNAMSIQVDEDGYYLGLNPNHEAVKKRSIKTLKELFHELITLALLEELKTRPIKSHADLVEQKHECLYPDDRFSYPQLADIILNTYLSEE